MREFIYQELVIGQGRLPHWFQQYFENTNEREEILIKQKTWLINVRKGRKRYDQGNLFYNEFTNPKAFRDWLG